MRIKDIAYVKTGLNKGNNKANVHSKKYTLFFQQKDVNCMSLVDVLKLDVRVQEEPMHMLADSEHLLLAKGKKPVCFAVADYKSYLARRLDMENDKFTNDHSKGNWGAPKEVIGYSCSSDFLIMVPRHGCESMLALVAYWMNTPEGQSRLQAVKTSKPTLKYITKSNLEMLEIPKFNRNYIPRKLEDVRKLALSKIEYMNSIFACDSGIEKLFEYAHKK